MTDKTLPFPSAIDCSCRSHFARTGEHADGCPLYSAPVAPEGEPVAEARDSVWLVQVGHALLNYVARTEEEANEHIGPDVAQGFKAVEFVPREPEADELVGLLIGAECVELALRVHSPEEQRKLGLREALRILFGAIHAFEQRFPGVAIRAKGRFAKVFEPVERELGAVRYGPGHVCGLSGFGALVDVCAACELRSRPAPASAASDRERIEEALLTEARRLIDDAQYCDLGDSCNNALNKELIAWVKKYDARKGTT